MPIEQFTCVEFEAALPVHKNTGQPLWKGLGLIDGEYCYLLPVTVHAGLLIRSSIKREGVSAGSGEDSIRIRIVRIMDLATCGSKLQKYTTRLPGWQARLTKQLRAMWSMAKETGPCGILHAGVPCNGWVGIYKCRTGANKNRLFRKCNARIGIGSNKRDCFFAWVTPEAPKAKSAH